MCSSSQINVKTIKPLRVAAQRRTDPRSEPQLFLLISFVPFLCESCKVNYSRLADAFVSKLFIDWSITPSLHWRASGTAVNGSVTQAVLDWWMHLQRKRVKLRQRAPWIVCGVWCRSETLHIEQLLQETSPRNIWSNCDLKAAEHCCCLLSNLKGVFFLFLFYLTGAVQLHQEPEAAVDAVSHPIPTFLFLMRILKCQKDGKRKENHNTRTWAKRINE